MSGFSPTPAPTMLKVISPIDGSVYAERPLAKPADIEHALERARTAQLAWRHIPISERARIVTKFCDAFEAKRDEIAHELTWQM
jgi:acyl-CoA reductase-like NAD-dependent aldehyde dehydrogenase